jgi:hypothetical protein
VPRLSIVLPCLQFSNEFENSLASILQNRPYDCEVLVTHANEYNDPYALSGEVCFLHIPEATNIPQLVNAGFEAARSGVVHVLQCGVSVEEDWVEPALECLQQEHVGIVTPVVVNSKQPDILLAAGWRLTPAGRCHLYASGKKIAKLSHAPNTILAPTIAAGFYRRSLWRLLRWETHLPQELTPLAFSLAAQELGIHTVLNANSIIHANEECITSQLEPFGYTLARGAEVLYRRQVSPNQRWQSQLLHAAYIALETLAAVPSPKAVSGLYGRFMGMLSSKQEKAYHEKITQCQLRLQEQRAEQEQTATVPFAVPTRDKILTRPKRRAA